MLFLVSSVYPISHSPGSSSPLRITGGVQETFGANSFLDAIDFRARSAPMEINFNAEWLFDINMMLTWEPG
jgi:hypothetical protein